MIRTPIKSPAFCTGSGRDFDRYNNNFHGFVNPNAMEILEKKYNLSLNKLKQLYFEDQPITYEKYVDMAGDLYFVEGIHETVKIQVQKSSLPTYLYRYDFDKGISSLKLLTKTRRLKGIDNYLFYIVTNLYRTD